MLLVIKDSLWLQVDCVKEQVLQEAQQQVDPLLEVQHQVLLQVDQLLAPHQVHQAQLQEDQHLALHQAQPLEEALSLSSLTPTETLTAETLQTVDAMLVRTGITLGLKADVYQSMLFAKTTTLLVPVLHASEDSHFQTATASQPLKTILTAKPVTPTLTLVWSVSTLSG